jgi:diacylglycerol kinase family enzyme
MTGIEHIKKDLGPIALTIHELLKNHSIENKFSLLLWVNPQAGIWNKKVKPVFQEPLHSQIFSIPHDEWSINHPVKWQSHDGYWHMHHPHLAIEVIIAGNIETAAVAMEKFIDDSNPDQDCVIVSGGGDGTHRTVANILLKSQETSRKLFFLRLPLGSGNDGSCTPETQEFFSILKQGLQSRSLKYLEMQLANGENHRSFNILSLGMDAYVAHLNNKLKKILSGNVYKKVTDLAMLFYPGKKALGLLDVAITTKDQKPEQWIESPGLLAMGCSGKRIYGQGYNILPDQRNLCLIAMASLIKNAMLKPKIFSGEHLENERVSMYETESIEIKYNKSLWFQCDGESGKLNSDAFPLKIQLLNSKIEELWP